jgi:hypothetical protein
LYEDGTLVDGVGRQFIALATDQEQADRGNECYPLIHVG